MSEILLGLLFVLGCAVLGCVFWLIKLQTDSRRGLMQQVSHEFSRTGLELKAELAQKLSETALNTQERLSQALMLNRTELQSGLALTTQVLEGKFKSLEDQVGLRLETIGKNVEEKLNQNIKEGFSHFEKVQEHLKAAELRLASLTTVSQSVSELNSLLKLPHLRGGFGEATLERLLQDFLPRSEYEFQYQIDPSSTERVDAIVRLSSKVVPIDSKFPREQVLPLFSSDDPNALGPARKQLSEVVRGLAKSIAKKYIRPELGTTKMALLFLPSETLYFEILRDADLFEQLSKLMVYPISPNTLSISLHSIAMAQDYYEMARGVEKTLEEVGKARKHFEHFEQRFEDVGKGIKKAQEAFETAQNHLGKYGTAVGRLVGQAAIAPPAERPLPPLSPSV